MRDARREDRPACQGAFAKFNFSPEQHVGITENPYVIGVVRDGKFQVEVRTAVGDAGRPPLIEARDLSACYGRVNALKPTSLSVGEGELVTVLGPNGAGKTTMLRAITRLTAASGRVFFRGRDITELSTHDRAREGIIMVRKAAACSRQMSVRENLVLGAYTRCGRAPRWKGASDQVFALFPRLKERFDQVAGSLSGGEQQMVAVGRAMMARPKLLMLDEPSLGPRPASCRGDPGDAGRTQPAGPRHPAGRAEGAAGLKLAQRVYVLSLGGIVGRTSG